LDGSNVVFFVIKQGIMKHWTREAKTLLLSALLAALGGVSVTARQITNINVTCNPGYTMISVPLIASPDNTVGTLLNNAGGSYMGDWIYTYDTAIGQLIFDEALPIGGRPGTTNTNGWMFAGTNILAPGRGAWFFNADASPVTLTFVGAVPTGSLTNTLVTGFNLVGSMLPASGDLCTNAPMTLTNFNPGDIVYVWANATGAFTIFESAPWWCNCTGFGYGGNWNLSGDPIIPNVGEGFWYDNSGAAINWVENSFGSP
jgi:hypothetical protein